VEGDGTIFQNINILELKKGHSETSIVNILFGRENEKESSLEIATTKPPREFLYFLGGFDINLWVLRRLFNKSKNLVHALGCTF
jgi:hypothetical protein